MLQDCFCCCVAPCRWRFSPNPMQPPRPPSSHETVCLSIEYVRFRMHVEGMVRISFLAKRITALKPTNYCSYLRANSNFQTFEARGTICNSKSLTMWRYDGFAAAQNYAQLFRSSSSAAQQGTRCITAVMYMLAPSEAPI